MIINKKQLSEIAYKLNPLIDDNAQDTMHKVSLVLGYLSDVKLQDGIVANDDYSYSQELIYRMCRNASMFHVNDKNI